METIGRKIAKKKRLILASLVLVLLSSGAAGCVSARCFLERHWASAQHFHESISEVHQSGGQMERISFLLFNY